ncbi:endo-1 [Vigna unguiculata]|uniref:glucan endo-1,3-beta-D-glucosidase n=1 Tax=Vigna unguiculata TaxID=3917 RepID=A0A4D6LVU2_VIGUN|nr:endo-1 [Vigna unguiculata]
MAPYIFPQTRSTVLPEPSNFFSSNLVSSPLPTNSFFQNFVLKNGDQPEYIHPYLIKSSNSSLSLSYPSRSSTVTSIYQVFNPDLTISSKQTSSGKHTISSFSDLSVTLEIPSSNLTFFLVRGSPYLTVSVTQPTPLSITTIHSIVSLDSTESTSFHKFTIKFNNAQTWLLYASSPIKLTHTTSEITSEAFSGTIRIALLPNSDPQSEAILDLCSFIYPVSGNAVIKEPFCVEYKWETKGSGALLLLAHPLHLQLLSSTDTDVAVLDGFKYTSIDGDLVGVMGKSWILKTDPVSVTWHSSRGIKEENKEEIISALVKDAEALKMDTSESYFYGKYIARAARLALIAEEVFFYEVIPMVCKFLKDTVEPWLDGTLKVNGFMHDHKWGGIVTYKGSDDASADFGFGIYNDHQYHLGYFLYAIAVVAKIDPAWGRKYKNKAYSLMQDFMNLDTQSNSNYPKLRCFDLYKLHSWAAGLTEFVDGRNHESTSQALNAYYSAALMGMAYGDVQLVALGSTLAALEILAARTWFQVSSNGSMYEDVFTQENRIMGILWSNKRDSDLWFASHKLREYRLGIHLLPIVPISEPLFSDVDYVIELVTWASMDLDREGADDAWKGFVYALQALYDKEEALQNVKGLKAFDNGNSFTNLLWWIHTRGDQDDK